MGLTWENTSTQIIFKLNQKEKDIPTQQWALVADKSEKPAIEKLFALVDADEAEEQENSISVSNQSIASLTSKDAAALNLPNPAPYILDITHKGTIDRSDFSFKTQWLKQGRPIISPKREGVFLKVGSQEYRIQEPYYSIIEEIDHFHQKSDANMDDRFKAWGKIREKYLDTEDSDIKFDSYLAGTKVGLATKFTLRPKKQNGEFQFEPVLVTNAQPDDENETIVETDPNLFPPHYQNVFAKRFEDSPSSQARYALEKGWYVVVDPALQKSLQVVKTIQQSKDESIRRSFFKNPQSYIEKELGEDADNIEIDSVFVETEAYSERILGEGLWKPKVIPWIKSNSNDPWLPPEQLGIKVGNNFIDIEPKEFDEVIKKAKSAIEKGEKTFKHKGQEIPATPEIIGVLEGLPGIARPTQPKTPQKPESVKQSLEQKVLKIDDNFEATGYIAKTRPHQARDVSLPVSLSTELKEHQVTGLTWLQEHWKSGSPGALLADDMGLGKTLQCLAFMAWLREEMVAKMVPAAPMLVVAPTGLLENWRKEYHQHFKEPSIGDPLLAYSKDLKNLRMPNTGSSHELKDATPKLNMEIIRNAPWVLTTYETLRNYQHSFCSIKYAAAVFDEVQKIKTPGIVMTEAAKAVHAEFVLTMTGTPIENRLADLWCIIDTTQPGLLNDLKSFSERYEKPKDIEIIKERLSELKESLMDNNDANNIAVIKRRWKTDNLKGLPDKIEHVIPKPMPTLQAQAYSKIVEDYGQAEGDRGRMLKALHSLRNVSLHPLKRSDESDDEYISFSARTQTTIEILDKIKEQNEKALIFLESRDLQETLCMIIQARYDLPDRPMVINGAISGPKRQERVNLFQDKEGFEVMILSPRAGGVGITLTAANHVIHLSRWWNPAVEDQCSDRAYRMGQEKDVHIYYPQAVHPIYSEHSYDLHLHNLLNRKRDLSHEFLIPSNLNAHDMSEFYEQTVKSSGTDQKTNDVDALLRQIDSMHPLEFEDWSLDQLRTNGYKVSKTPQSHDCGADGIAYPDDSDNKLPVIIQCKHTQTASRSSRGAIDDLARAKDSYIEGPVRLCAITNSDKFTSADVAESKKLDIQLVTRSMLVGWPNNLL